MGKRNDDLYRYFHYSFIDYFEFSVSARVFILLICLSLSSCSDFLKPVKALVGGGQSGGTHNDISVPIGDNKKQGMIGDSVSVDKAGDVTIKNGDIWYYVVSLIALLIFSYFKRSAPDKQKFKGMGKSLDALKSENATLHQLNDLLKQQQLGDNNNAKKITN